MKQCPSGALSFYMNANGGKEEKTVGQTKITVTENGPLLVSGAVTIEHRDGSSEAKASAAFCRCGHSDNKPYCDGSHKKKGFIG